MYRRLTDPAERRLAHRWMALSLAFYLTLMLAILAFAHFTAPPVKDQVAQAPANATALRHPSAGR
jgi:hypothetical protein